MVVRPGYAPAFTFLTSVRRRDGGGADAFLQADGHGVAGLLPLASLWTSVAVNSFSMGPPPGPFGSSLP